MTIRIRKNGKKYEVVDSQEGVMTTHYKKANATKILNKLKKEKSQMSRYSR